MYSEGCYVEVTRIDYHKKEVDVYDDESKEGWTCSERFDNMEDMEFVDKYLHTAKELTRDDIDDISDW